jgi:hypothetical protein
MDTPIPDRYCNIKERKWEYPTVGFFLLVGLKALEDMLQKGEISKTMAKKMFREYLDIVCQK